MPDWFAECLKFTLIQEGGFVDDPRDPGGATNQGITLATLRAWSGDNTLGVAAVRDISPDTVQAIYGADFWNRMRCDTMPGAIALMVFDQGVNSGSASSVRLLQHALNFSADAIDGCAGPLTCHAAANTDPAALLAAVADRQSAYYKALAQFPRYGKGWLERVDRRRQAAMAMLPAATG